MSGQNDSMTKRILTTGLFLCMSVFLLAGCGEEEPSTPPPPQVIDNETLVSSTPAQRAHANCVSQGYDLVIERSEITGPELFCEFPDDSRCPALSFLLGDCEPETALVLGDATTTAALDDVFDRPRFCEPIAEPVCGVNGRTYSNECIAEQQAVPVQYEGTCDPSIEPTSPPTVYDPNPFKEVDVQETQSANSGANGTSLSNDGNSSQGTIPQQSAPQAPAQQVDQAPIYTDEGIPDWLAVPFSLIDGNQSVTEAWVERCRVAGATYYLQVENCEDCFSTLYDESGTLMCNPSHDLNGSCPGSFQNGKPGSCIVILRK